MTARSYRAPIGCTRPFPGNLAQSDPEIARFIDLEVNRQRNGLELIASGLKAREQG